MKTETYFWASSRAGDCWERFSGEIRVLEICTIIWENSGYPLNQWILKKKVREMRISFFLWGGGRGHQWMAQWCFFNQNQAETRPKPCRRKLFFFSFSLNCLSKRRQDPSVHSFLLEITRGGSTFPAIYSGRGNRDKGGNQNFWGHKGGQNQKWKFWICIKTLNQVKIWFTNSLKKTSSGNLFRGLKSQPITTLLTTNGLEDTNPGEVPTRFKVITFLWSEWL